MYVKRVVYGLCVLMTMTAIFGFSSQTYDQTMQTSDLIVKPIENNVKNDSSAFESEEEETKYLRKLEDKLDRAVRKSAHIIIYGVLAVFVYLFCKSFGISDADAIVLTLIICGLYAGTDELHQRFVEKRGSHFSDICIDEMGVVIGMIIMRAANKIRAYFNGKY